VSQPRRTLLLRIRSAGWWVAGWLWVMNEEGCERKRSWSILRNCPELSRHKTNKQCQKTSMCLLYQNPSSLMRKVAAVQRNGG
jgi:hypothetical protein